MAKKAKVQLIVTVVYRADKRDTRLDQRLAAKAKSKHGVEYGSDALGEGEYDRAWSFKNPAKAEDFRKYAGSMVFANGYKGSAFTTELPDDE